MFHPVYVNNYIVLEAIFKYDVCHISSLRPLTRQLSIRGLNKTYFVWFINEQNAIIDEILVHKPKPPVGINVYGSNRLAPIRDFVLCRGFAGGWS